MPAIYDPGDLTDLEMQPGEFILFQRTHPAPFGAQPLRPAAGIGLAVRAIIPIVKVLEYDSPDHALQIIHGTDTMRLNRLAPPTPPLSHTLQKALYDDRGLPK